MNPARPVHDRLLLCSESEYDAVRIVVVVTTVLNCIEVSGLTLESNNLHQYWFVGWM